MKIVIACSLIVGISAAIGSASLIDKSLESEWELFKETFSKKYRVLSEELQRRLIWQQNRRTINEHNAQADSGSRSYRMAINRFADRTTEEVLSGYDRPVIKSLTGIHESHSTSLVDLPEVVDWTKKGFVTPVTDQGLLGSPVAVAVGGTAESVLAIKNRKLIPLAYQQIGDCYNGNFVKGAFDYIIKVGGLMSEAAYANSTKGETCHFDPAIIECRLSTYKSVNPSEESLQAAVASVGPIAVEINASKFLFYSGGIFDDVTCGMHDPNHALLVTGYGSEDDEDFWSVKNSWGAAWGEHGYIRIKRNAKICNISDYAFYPVLA